jgi:putative salt-induced outer membrane protein YdiY
MLINCKFSRLLLALLMTACLAHADVLVGTNGERFVGKVIEETPDAVVFESELGGRLTLPRARVREMQRTPTTPEIKTAPTPLVATTPASAQWIPPGAGTDGFDWIELNTGEWLKGWLKYIQERDIVFESDKLEEQKFEWKDIRQIYTGQPMYAKFDGQEQIYGSIVVSNQMVRVNGPEQVTVSRYQLTGITPGNTKERSFWSGKASVGMNFQSGNTEQTAVNVSAELARRTPSTEVLLSYLASYSEVNGTQNANNQRVDATFDVLLSRSFFVRPLQFDFYSDPLANIKYRNTIGTGVGYYIFNRDRLKWLVAGGPGYQHTRFDTVQEGQAADASTLAGILQTSFKADLTSRIKFLQSFDITLTDLDSGRYAHHSVTSLEFEIKHHLDLNVSFIWDYLQNPTPESNGTVPLRSDTRLTLSLGAKF